MNGKKDAPREPHLHPSRGIQDKVAQSHRFQGQLDYGSVWMYPVIDENRGGGSATIIYKAIKSSNASHERSDNEGGRRGKPVPVHGVLNDKEIKATSRSVKKHNSNKIRKQMHQQQGRCVQGGDMEVNFAKDTGMDLTNIDLGWRVGEGCDADSGVGVISRHARVDGRLERNDSVVTWVLEGSNQGLNRSVRTFAWSVCIGERIFVRIGNYRAPDGFISGTEEGVLNFQAALDGTRAVCERILEFPIVGKVRADLTDVHHFCTFPTMERRGGGEWRRLCRSHHDG